ncbi:MAG: response regulator [Acidobacteria bacterium]|nr:response regulator [Acidobacteriota bacterium]
MSNNPVNDSSQQAAVTAHPRRALIIAETAGLSLQQQLTAAGYLARAATIADAPRAIHDFNPDVIIMVLAHAGGDTENENVALARKLRAETATYSFPIVFAWTQDEHALRTAAQYIGADDYFHLATPPEQILARLDSLFWRVEADRRNAPVISDRRLEIDNFMFMLDAVREDVRAGVGGTLALIYAVAPRGNLVVFDKAARDATLTEAHNFLKLNLRRIDAVAFYGPTTLLVYLPRMETPSAIAALSRLHREFLEEHLERDYVTGVASFPAHGSDVETLIERAERAVSAARTDATAGHVIAYQSKEGETESRAPVASPEPARELQVAEEKEALMVSPPADTSVPEPQIEHEAKEKEMPEKTAASEKNDEAPSKDIDAGRAAEAAATERERRASGAVMPRRLLLTISDSARMAQVNSLIRSAGYEARAAFDGQQALHLLRIERPDLLLLDYELQGIDGVETIRRLRKQSGGRLGLPVVMLISSNNESARREALELGAHSVVVIPYDPVALLATVRDAGSIE